MSLSLKTMETPIETESKPCVLCDHTPCVLGGADKTMWLCLSCDADVNERLRLREAADKTKMKTCETCETKMDHWWDDEEGLPFCSSCFKEEGGQCDGCHWDDCVLCHEEEEEWCEEHEQRMWNEHGEKCGACLEKESECPGCLRSKADEEYREARCCRCDTEMCGQCYSVSPIEGDDECYCKRCAQDRLDEKEMKLNPDLGFDHEGYWILNPYVSQCGRRDGEYGKTHEELLAIFKTQAYLDWLKASGEFAVE